MDWNTEDFDGRNTKSADSIPDTDGFDRDVGTGELFLICQR